MRPVTRLCKTVKCSHSSRTSVLKPVCRQRQIGVFFGCIYMFLYRAGCVLLVLASLVNANAEEGSGVIRQGYRASAATEFEPQGDAYRLNSGEGKAAAASAATVDHRVRASNFTPRKIPSSVVGGRAQHSVNAIGARWGDGRASIVQREDHHFYVVWEHSDQIDDQKTPTANDSPDSTDEIPRFSGGARIGNVFVDPALLQRSARSSNGGQR